SAKGLPSRLEQLDLQLRTKRGPELPAVERHALALDLPRGRSPRGRRRLDALPRLLAEGRRVDTEPVRRAGEPRGHRVPPAVEPRGVPGTPRRPDHRR